MKSYQEWELEQACKVIKEFMANNEPVEPEELPNLGRTFNTLSLYKFGKMLSGDYSEDDPLQMQYLAGPRGLMPTGTKSVDSNVVSAMIPIVKRLLPKYDKGDKSRAMIFVLDQIMKSTLFAISQVLAKVGMGSADEK